jgi:hypothetical protein
MSTIMDGTLCALELQCDEHRDHNNNAGLEAKRDILGGTALKLSTSR